MQPKTTSIFSIANGSQTRFDRCKKQQSPMCYKSNFQNNQQQKLTSRNKNCSINKAKLVNEETHACTKINLVISTSG